MSRIGNWTDRFRQRVPLGGSNCQHATFRLVEWLFRAVAAAGSSAGPRRFTLPITVARLDLAIKPRKVEFVDLEKL